MECEEFFDGEFLLPVWAKEIGLQGGAHPFIDISCGNPVFVTFAYTGLVSYYGIYLWKKMTILLELYINFTENLFIQGSPI